MTTVYSTYEILDKKRKKQALDPEEIKWFITQYIDGHIPDYQMSALLMAIAINGANTQETSAFTDTMLYSGKTFNFNDQTVIDKHSTGGIGDKTSFILAPIAAVCGVKVPMIAGRALGFTGGTVDKIESIKNFKTSLTNEEFEEYLTKNHLVLMGQTDDIAPADKKIYALRDVTATIESIPLITASIMSKKLAEGANGIVMDIKLGSGAFMKKHEDAKDLAQSIINTAKRFDKKATAVLSNMDQPLGQMVGNSLEIIESIETLKGRGPKDLTELSLCLCAYMILQAHQAKTYDEAYKMASEAITSGKALKKFQEMIIHQQGDGQVVEDYQRLPLAKVKTQVLATEAGFIQGFKTAEIGYLLIHLGGGRKTKKDEIDFGVGFEFHKKIGDAFNKGEPLLTIYHHASQENEVKHITKRMLDDVISISADTVKKPETIYEVMGDFS